MSLISHSSPAWINQSALLLDNIPDAVISTDLNYHITGWNKAAEKMFGYDAAAVMGRVIDGVARYEFLTDSRELAWEKLKVNGTWKGEVLQREADGKEVFLAISSSYVMDPAGDPVGYISIYRDITEMKHIKDALVTEQNRFRDLIQNVPGVVYQWEENNDGTFGFSYLSPKIQDYFGIYPEQISDLSTRIHPDDWDRLRRSIEEANRTEKPWEFEGRAIYPDGSIRWWRGNSVLSMKTSRGRIYNGIAFDITRQRALEKQVQEEEAGKKREIIQAIMEAQEKERREISSELHDNVNQMLTTCKLFLEIAKNNPADGRFVDECYRNIQSVIMEIRNISHNLTPYTLKDLGLAAALYDIVEKINQSGKLMIRLLSFDELEEDKISPDIKLALFRIIQEKISNVLKHSGATELKIKIRIVGGEIRLVLSDNGRGFDAKSVKKGMGLNNIDSRVEYYKGTIQLKTAPGAGCEIRINLPCAQ